MPRRVAPEVEARLRLLGAEPASRAWGAAQVHKKLCDKFPQPDDLDPISLRHVQRVWPELQRLAAATWTMRRGEPEPAFLLDVLALSEEPGGLSTSQAEWILRSTPLVRTWGRRRCGWRQRCTHLRIPPESETHLLRAQFDFALAHGVPAGIAWVVTRKVIRDALVAFEWNVSNGDVDQAFDAFEERLRQGDGAGQ